MNQRVGALKRVFATKKEFFKRLSEEESYFINDVLLPIFRKHKMGLVATETLADVNECSFPSMREIWFFVIGETDNVYHALKECREKRCAVFLDFENCVIEMIVKIMFAINIGKANRIIHIIVPVDNFKVKGIRL